MRPASNLPTDGELEVLTILWKDGPLTVRELHEQLSRRKQVGYTSVLKLMQIMHEKGYVARDTSARSHIYRAVPARDRTQHALVDDLMKRAFGGSAAALVQRALSSKHASAKELEEIRRMLEELPEKKK
ncbi:MAG TPA: BlaI/MecI/CopY family transcriptional regulator [Longimicrobiales bacterium]|nr:BlaI/MecI/CopY family transcriptional regulator [Longimicrobiales bacterium]